MKAKHALTLCVLLLVVGGVAVGLSLRENAPEGTLSPTLNLISLQRVNKLDLPVEWYSLRTYEEVDPRTLVDPRPEDVTGKRLAEDAFGIPPGVMTSFIAGLQSTGASGSVWLPGESSLALHWESSAGILKAVNLAADFGPSIEARGGARLIYQEDNSSSAGKGSPMSRVAPPDRWWAVPGDANLPERAGRPSPQSGLGFFEVSGDGSGVFAAGGTLKQGIKSSVTAWLHIAEDEFGDLWFWFQESP
jgi:hypothetical protein